MKTAGIFVAVIGGLLTLSSINVAVTQYDLSSSHDASKAAGSFGVSLGLLVAGFLLYTKGKNRAE